MTNRVEVQKIQERRAATALRPEWFDLADRHAAPRNNALVIIIPLLGFALTIMLILSFASVLLGKPASRLESAPTHEITNPARTAVFVL